MNGNICWRRKKKKRSSHLLMCLAGPNLERRTKMKNSSPRLMVCGRAKETNRNEWATVEKKKKNFSNSQRIFKFTKKKKGKKNYSIRISNAPFSVDVYTTRHKKTAVAYLLCPYTAGIFFVFLSCQEEKKRKENRARHHKPAGRSKLGNRWNKQQKYNNDEQRRGRTKYSDVYFSLWLTLGVRSCVSRPRDEAQFSPWKQQKKRQRMWNCEGDWPQHWTHTNKNVLHVLIEFACGFAPSLLRKAFDGQRASIEKKTWNLRKRSVPQSKIYNLIVGAGSSPTCLLSWLLLYPIEKR